MNHTEEAIMAPEHQPDPQHDAHLARQLAAPFDELRAGMAAQQAPRGVEKELLAAFAKQFPPLPWYRRLGPRWRTASLLGSGAVAAMVAVVVLHMPGQVAPKAVLASVSIDEGADFFALEPIERIEQETNPRMVQADVARTELAAFGIPLTPENAGDSVRADVLVGADGAPLALRISFN